MKYHRIFALFTRNIYLYKRSFPRMLEIFYWPLLDLLVWGFLTVYLTRGQENFPGFVAFFIGALILWDILWRAQTGISVSFLEDIWSKNLLNLFTSPLKPEEYIIALMMVGTVKLVVIAAIMTFLAWLVYSFNIFVIGISLVPFVLNLLVLGWAIGIFTIALILRFGQEAEVLAWALGFLFLPISAVFYPVSVLPPFVQAIARCVPSSYVFEGMRTVIASGKFPLHDLMWAVGLNTLYILFSFFFFRRIFNLIKRKGLLVRIGE